MLAGWAIVFAAAIAATHAAAPASPQERVRFGHSVEGQALRAIRIGDAVAQRTVLVVGSIHGDERAGHRVVRALRRRHRGAADVAIWLVRTVNPDGVKRRTRKNARGVDLNRNFSRRWSDAEPPSSGYYGGREPFSEPESRAVRRLVRRIEPDVTIWYHQPWNAVLGCGRGAKLERRYARIARMRTSCRGNRLPGTASRWQNHRSRGRAFVVELAPGRLSGDEARRHGRAVVAIGRSRIGR